MNDFKATYRILKALSDAIDLEEFDASRYRVVKAEGSGRDVTVYAEPVGFER